jgi:hypothetical protein
MRAFNRLSRLFSGSRKPTTIRPKTARRRLMVEQLEDRLVPAFFYPPTLAPGGFGPQLLAKGHFNTNNDYHEDVAVTNSNGSYTVLLGNGNGVFTYKGTYDLPGATGSEGIVAGDFSGHGNGTDDLAIASYSGQVRILLANGDGTFSLGQTLDLPAGAGPTYVAVGDLNHDNVPDLVVADYNNNQLLVYQGNGDGTFSLANIINDVTYGGPTGIRNPDQIVLADFTGSGDLDVAVANQGNDSVTVMRGYGNFYFGQAYNQHIYSLSGGPAGPTGLAVGYFEKDGLPDLAVANYGSDAKGAHTLTLLKNTSKFGNPSFTEAQEINVGQHLINVVAADFRNDGNTELAVTSAGDTNTPGAPPDNHVYMLGDDSLGGNPYYVPFESYTVGNNPVGLITADLNEDGYLDLVNTNQNDNTVSVLQNKGAVFAPFALAANDPAPAALNGPAKPDAALPVLMPADLGAPANSNLDTLALDAYFVPAKKDSTNASADLATDLGMPTLPSL